MWQLAPVLLIAVSALADPEPQYCKHNGTAECDCDFGWTGPRCDNPIDFCNRTEIIRNGVPVIISICGEHGNCTNQPNGAKCICDPGWDGPYCQHNKDACDPNPCEGGATCIDLEGPGYYCLCPKWRTGQNCSHWNICNNVNVYHLEENLIPIEPCGKHGNCTDTESGILCTCDHGYFGPFCEHRNETACEHMGSTHAHNDVWRERCNTCQCKYGQVECEQAHWCPKRCLVYPPPGGADARGIRVGCEKLRENCIPDDVACARENQLCPYPIGWCFPIGVVALASPTPNPLPNFTPPPTNASAH